MIVKQSTPNKLYPHESNLNCRKCGQLADPRRLLSQSVFFMILENNLNAYPQFRIYNGNGHRV